MMKFLSKLFKEDDLEDEADVYEESREKSANQNESLKSNVMSLVSNKKEIEKKILIFEPQIFSDVKQIATRLKNDQATIVNFQRIDEATAHRILDFLSGVVYAVDGDIQRIGTSIFLCTPSDYKVESNMFDHNSHGDRFN